MSLGSYWPNCEIKASNMITIEPSLLLSQKGTRGNRIVDYRDDSVSYFSDTKWEYKFIYLDIPVLVRFKIFSGLEFYLGPQFSYLVKTSSTSRSNMIYNEKEHLQENEEKGLKGYNIFDLSVSGGVGYSFENGINVNVGYDYGLYTLQDEGPEGKYYNRVMKISLGYYF